jgi:hypothetical protein
MCTNKEIKVPTNSMMAVKPSKNPPNSTCNNSTSIQIQIGKNIEEYSRLKSVCFKI